SDAAMRAVEVLVEEAGGEFEDAFRGEGEGFVAGFGLGDAEDAIGAVLPFLQRDHAAERLAGIVVAEKASSGPVDAGQAAAGEAFVPATDADRDVVGEDAAGDFAPFDRSDLDRLRGGVEGGELVRHWRPPRGRAAHRGPRLRLRSAGGLRPGGPRSW